MLGLACLALPSISLAATSTTIGKIPGMADGDTPQAALTFFKGVYYSTTSGNIDTGGSGSMYRIDLKTGAERVIYAFTGGTDGGNPAGGLTELDGKLYGATSHGGADGGGTVFTVDPASGTETVVANLPDGTFPGGV